MTTPGGGGDRLDVEVVADASGFARDAKRKIDEATRNVRARIRAEIDARRLTIETQAAARAAANTTRVQLKVGVDREYLRQSMDRAVRELSNREYRVKVGVEADTAKVEADLQRATRGGKAKIDVDADTTAAEAQVEGMRRRQSRPIDVNVRVKSNGLRQAQRGLQALGKIGMVAGAIQFVTSAITALTAGLFAMTAAASQAAGTLAILPNLIGTALMGIGTLVAGFSGIGDAVSAMGAAEQGAGAAASRAADTRAQAARRIADAQRNVQRAQQAADRTAIDGARAVAQARQRVADAQASAAQRIANAERSVESAQRSRQRAQESLNDAIEDATRKLRDYQLQLSGAALDEESAALAVQRARQRLDEVNRDPGSTQLDRQEADLAVRQALQRLAEVQQSNKDLQAEAAEGYAKGVMGADNVVAAQESVQDANRDVADAERELAQTRVEAARDVADAQYDLQRTIEDTARANADAQEGIADAQRDLADAIADAAQSASAAAPGVDKLAQAMDNLSPAGQRFARFVADVLQPRLKELRFAIQEAMLPGIQEGVTRALPWLDTLQAGLVDTGSRLGELAIKAGDLMASGPFRADTATVMASNNRALTLFGDAGLNLMRVFMDIAVAAGPMLERFAEWTVRLTEGWAATTAANRESGAMAGFFERAGDRAGQLTRIIRDLWMSLVNMGKAGSESGDSLLGKLEQLAARWRDWTASDEGQTRMREFFANMQPLFEEMMRTIGLLIEAFVKLGENGGGAISGFLGVINALLEALIWLLDSPIGPFISAFLTLAGVAGGISFLAGAVLGMVTPIKSLVGYAGGLITFARGLNLAAAGARAMAIAQGILNAVMAVNPFVLILLAIAGLVAAFIWAWNNVDGFKEGVIGALEWLRDAMLVVWEAIKTAVEVVWDAIKTYFEVWWTVVSTIFETAVNAIKAVVEFVWNAIKLYFETWWTVVSTIFQTALDVITTILQTAWDVITTVVQTVWNTIRTIIETVWNAIRTVFETVIGVIQGIWNGFWNTIRTVAETVFNAVASAIDGVLGGIRRSFEVVVGAISAVWDGLRAAIRAPIEFVVNTVYNGGIRPAWNAVSGLFNGPQLPEYRFAKGGTVPGYAPGRDTIPAVLSPGEGVLVPEAVVALGGPKGIQAINSEFSSRVNGGGLPGMSRRRSGATQRGRARQEDRGRVGLGLGDLWDATGGKLVSGAADLWDATGGKVVSSIGDLLAEGWAKAVELTLRPLRGLAASVLPDNGIGTTLENAVNLMLDRVQETITNREGEYQRRMAEQANVGGDVSRWSSLVAETLRELGQPADMLPWVLKLIERESGGNPNATNNWDVNAQRGDPSRGLMQTIGATFNAYAGPYRSRGITDPKANIYAGLNYGKSRYGSVANIPGIRSMRAGGPYKPYDRGGRLAPGVTLALNKTGVDEAVLTPEAIAALGGWGPIDALNRGSDLATALQRSTSASIGDVTTGDVYGVYFADGAIRLTAVNPTPEPASTSLNSGLRRAATFGIFDDAPVGG